MQIHIFEILSKSIRHWFPKTAFVCRGEGINNTFIFIQYNGLSHLHLKDPYGSIKAFRVGSENFLVINSFCSVLSRGACTGARAHVG